jgi:hypothetical protein
MNHPIITSPRFQLYSITNHILITRHNKSPKNNYHKTNLSLSNSTSANSAHTNKRKKARDHKARKFTKHNDTQR